MKKKIPILILINLFPSIISLLCCRTGYISTVLMIILTPCSICLNFKLTTKIRGLMLCNILFFAVSSVGLLFSTTIYLWEGGSWELGADTWDSQTVDILLAIWLVTCISFILGTLICSLLKQKKRIPAIIFTGILFIYTPVSVVLGYLSLIPAAYEYSYIDIYNNGMAACSESYEGWISNRGCVIISDRKNGTKKELSEVELGIIPSQIALGEQHFYVLNDNDYDPVIIKVDYEGNVISKIIPDDTPYLLSCKNGVLFSLTENNYNIEYDIPIGLRANQYIPETDFEQGKLIDCEADSDGICHVGSMSLYDHGKYFSTNPVISSYAEGNHYYVGEEEFLEDTKQTQWTDLVENMLEGKGLSDYSHKITEYQNGYNIYGVAEIRSSVLGYRDRKLKKSLAYKISCETGEISLLAEKDNVFIILATDDYLIYQDHSEVMCEELSTEKTLSLGNISSNPSHFFTISGEYIQFENSEYEKQRMRWSGIFLPQS